MSHARAVAATVTFSDGHETEIAAEDAARLYFAHTFQKPTPNALGRVAGKSELERWLQHRIVTWLERHEIEGRQRALIIGDSIRHRPNTGTGYGLHAYRRLLDTCNLTHIPHNAGGTKPVLAFLDDWLTCAPDVVHVNAGLHDLSRTPNWRSGGPVYTTPDEYRENLRVIIGRIRATPSVRTVIWGRLTPVVDEWHSRPGRSIWRRQADVDVYNAVADEVMGAEGVPVNDLGGAMQAAGVEECLLADGVHLSHEGATLVGDLVARRVAEAVE